MKLMRPSDMTLATNVSMVRKPNAWQVMAEKTQRPLTTVISVNGMVMVDTKRSAPLRQSTSPFEVVLKGRLSKTMAQSERLPTMPVIPKKTSRTPSMDFSKMEISKCDSGTMLLAIVADGQLGDWPLFK